MLLWTLAIVLLGCAVVAGYYQGAIRAGFTLLGLLLGIVFSLPLAGLGQSLLSTFGLQHPVLLEFLGPTVVLLLLFLIFKSAGFFAHSKIYQYYKYKTEEERRVMWERLNQQLGLCLGAVNGVVIVFLISIGIYLPGYFFVQVDSSNKDPWWLKFITALSHDLDRTGFYRALSPFVPVSDFYFQAADNLGLIFRNPGLQDRLSRYPLLMPLAEEGRFLEVGKDTEFQKFWKEDASILDYINHERINPLVRDADLYTMLAELLSGHLRDLKVYLEKGVSPQFAEDRLVDRWYFNFPASYNQARRIKPNMTVAERQWLRAVYQTSWKDATLTAFLDKSVLLKNKTGSGKPQSLKGKWEHAYGSKYLVQLREGGRWNEFEGLVETDRFTLIMEKLVLVFDR